MTTIRPMDLAKAWTVLSQYRHNWTHSMEQAEAMDFALAIMEALMR